jgi:hypothetical protein
MWFVISLVSFLAWSVTDFPHTSPLEHGSPYAAGN